MHQKGETIMAVKGLVMFMAAISLAVSCRAGSLQSSGSPLFHGNDNSWSQNGACAGNNTPMTTTPLVTETGVNINIFYSWGCNFGPGVYPGGMNWSGEGAFDMQFVQPIEGIQLYVYSASLCAPVCVMSTLAYDASGNRLLVPTFDSTSGDFFISLLAGSEGISSLAFEIDTTDEGPWDVSGITNAGILDAGQPPPVPEPTPALLFGTAFLFLATVRRYA
jgi:hypothetical protein